MPVALWTLFDGVKVESVRRLAALDTIEAVLVGDGWPVFRDGHRALSELARSLTNPS